MNRRRPRTTSSASRPRAFDRRLQLNANLFLVDVKDYQATQLAEVTTGVFVQVLSNIGKACARRVWSSSCRPFRCKDCAYR